MKAAIYYLFWFAIVSFMAGCATPPSNSLEKRAAQVNAPFELLGRVAIKHDTENFSAGLRWKHSLEADELYLLAPLGQTVALLQRNKTGVTLEADGKLHEAQNMEALTLQVLGWELPLSGLSYWVVALPAPANSAEIQRNSNGQVSVLRQDGWEINYSRYASQAADSLPLRLELQREHLKIKIFIDEWKNP